MIRTCGARWFSYLHQSPEDFDIETIAHSLSQQCRFTGHTRKFYSVAQHSVHVSEICVEEPKWGLMHDAIETFMGDMNKPLKQLRGMEAYTELELEILERYAGYNNLPWPIPKCVEDSDDILLDTEQRDLMPKTGQPLSDIARAMPKRLKAWKMKKAKRRFLKRYKELFG